MVFPSTLHSVRVQRRQREMVVMKGLCLVGLAAKQHSASADLSAGKRIRTSESSLSSHTRHWNCIMGYLKFHWFCCSYWSLNHRLQAERQVCLQSKHPLKNPVLQEDSKTLQTQDRVLSMGEGKQAHHLHSHNIIHQDVPASKKLPRG